MNYGHSSPCQPAACVFIIHRLLFIVAAYLCRQNVVLKKIKIGTRGSHLALWQAEFTQQQLTSIGVESELVIIKTKGDAHQHLSFDKIEGKVFFTKEIEDAVLRGEVDMAVHSMKDLPTTQPEGLVVAGVSYRENPADWLIFKKEEVVDNQLFGLKNRAVVGTSSARRKAQLLDFRNDLEMRDLRGNVSSRLEKLRNGDFDAIMLAGAGLVRLALDLSGFEVVDFNPREFVPAPAQGVLAWQCCADDLETRRVLKKIHHPEVSAMTNIERKVLTLMGGGCHAPLGVYCEQDKVRNYHVWAAMADNWDGKVQRVRLSQSTNLGLAEAVVRKLRG